MPPRVHWPDLSIAANHSQQVGTKKEWGQAGERARLRWQGEQTPAISMRTTSGWKPFSCSTRRFSSSQKRLARLVDALAGGAHEVDVERARGGPRSSAARR